MQSMVVEEIFDPSEFEEPELYESMKILKSLDNIEKNVQKKNNLYDLKKTIKRDKLKEKEKVKSKMKRPRLDLEKMMKVIITDYFYLFIKILKKLYQFTFKSIFRCRSC